MGLCTCRTQRNEQKSPVSGFFGTTFKQSFADGLRLSLIAHDASATIPNHEHEWGLVSRLLRGDYISQTRSRELEVSHDQALYSPKGYSHKDRIGTNGARFFCIEFTSASIDVDDRGCISTTDHILLGENEHIHTINQLLSAFIMNASDLEIESLSAELIGRLFGKHSRQLGKQQFSRVKEKLRTDFAGKLRLSDLANELGIHATTLTRLFRKETGLSLGEYRRFERARAACHDVLQNEAPLAEIAAKHDYADQSHMTREFVRCFDAAPARLQRQLAACFNANKNGRPERPPVSSKE